MLNLDLALEDQRVRFYFGTAPLAEAEERVQRLEHMVDEVTARAQLETEEARLRAADVEAKLTAALAEIEKLQVR